MERALQAVIPLSRPHRAAIEDDNDGEEKQGRMQTFLQALASITIIHGKGKKEIEKNKKWKKKGILEVLPLEIFLLIASYLGPLDVVRLGLTCRTLWSLLGVRILQHHRDMLCRPFPYQQLDAWQMELWDRFAEREGRKKGMRPGFIEQPRWQLLRSLEKERPQRWLCCSGCRMLHPREEFSLWQRRFVDAEGRECRLGATGVVHLCHCKQLTYRDTVRLVQEMLPSPSPSSQRMMPARPESDDEESQDDVVIINDPLNNFHLPGRTPWHSCIFRDPHGICQVRRTIYLSIEYNDDDDDVVDDTPSSPKCKKKKKKKKNKNKNNNKGPFLFVDTILHVSLFRCHRLLDLDFDPENEETTRLETPIIPLCPHRNLFRFLDDIEQITFGIPWQSQRRNPGGSLFSVACDFCPSVFTMLVVQHFARLHRPRPYPDDPFRFTMRVARVLAVGSGEEGKELTKKCPELFYAQTDARYERASVEKRWQMNPNKPWVSWGALGFEDMGM